MEYTKSEILVAEYNRVFRKPTFATKFSPASTQIMKKELVGSCSTKGGTAANQHMLKEITHIIRKEVGMSKNTTITLLDENANKVDGEQDFKGNELTASANQLIKAIRVAYKTDVDTGKVSDLVYDANFDTFVRNSVLVFRQFDADVVRIPMTEFDPRTTGNNVGDKWLDIKSTPLFGGQPFDINIETPKNGTVPTEKTYFEISWYGLES